MTCYYNLLSETTSEDGTRISHFSPTIHAQGAWNKDEQHMAAASGIIARELECFMPRFDMRIGRISFDIWGKISLTDFSITTRLIRPGKTIELIEQHLEAAGKTCIVAHTWRMAKTKTGSVAGIEDKPVHSPEQCEPWPDIDNWLGGFIKSLIARRDKANRKGKGLIWINTPLNCLDNQPTSDFVHLVGLIDMANGTSPRQDKPFAFAFPNLDLQLHMYRLPKGRWLGLQSVQQYGEDGIGLSSSILHDVYGPFGRCEQILTLRALNDNV
ncbi:thioesterase family protein [Bartonella sp. HY329]|uniref:thioesterase family protein n=1 Tax=unclassified Bartonella TaxID=2645622 RepID=UPI0021C6A2A6|nr:MULTISPECIES: thioesterase family protein [unclassified Bartonella]UXM95529.1 thioesterase family protein [Bartonella sp. HY329]UXN09854.1 thioesterase family protein [Bartonella sp. HY328]